MTKGSEVVSKVKTTTEHVSAETSGQQTVGMDLGDRFSYFCVLAADGEIVAEGRVPTTPTAIRRYLESLPTCRIAMECGTHSPWISRIAEELGHHTLVANARELRKIHQNDRKSDRTDAEILARMARFDPDLMAPIEHRSKQMQADLAVIRARDALVGARTKCVNSVRGQIKAMGARLPKCSTHSFASKMLEHIPAELQDALLPLLAAIAALSEQIAQYDRKIEALATKQYPQAALLTPIVGVGALTAVTFLLTLADAGRFTKSRDVGPYLGLVPRRDDSGNRVSQLPITKAGDAHLRRLLVGSAQYILGPFGPDCDLRRHGERLMQRGGKNAKKRAVIAVARKLAVLMHHLWSTGEAYDPLYNARKSEVSMQAA